MFPVLFASWLMNELTNCYSTLHSIFLGYIRSTYLVMGSKREANCVYYWSQNMHIVCVGVYEWVLEWKIIWSFHSICMFMHSCLYAMCFHAWRCMICLVCLHLCLNSIYGFKKREAFGPAASWSNWHVNHVSVGGIAVCVFVKDPWLISRGNVWPRESCPPHRPALTLPWRGNEVSLSWREIGSLSHGFQSK